MKKHKRYRNQIKSDKQKEYHDMESSQTDMTNFRRPAYAVRHLDGYSDGECNHTQNTSMAGELIRDQAEQIRETPAEYVARKFNIRGDADDSQGSA